MAVVLVQAPAKQVAAVMAAVAVDREPLQGQPDFGEAVAGFRKITVLRQAKEDRLQVWQAFGVIAVLAPATLSQRQAAKAVLVAAAVYSAQDQTELPRQGVMVETVAAVAAVDG